eukprot:Sdes_comp20551_c0_seq2m15309
MGRPENLVVFYALAPPPPKTPFENLIVEEKVPTVFFVYFRQGRGALDLGLEVTSHFTEPMDTYPGASPVLWMLLAQTIKFDSFEWKNQGCEFSTGWPFIGIPDEYFNQIANLLKAMPVPGKEEYTVICLSQSVTYPDLQFTFRGYTYQLPASV